MNTVAGTTSSISRAFRGVPVTRVPVRRLLTRWGEHRDDIMSFKRDPNGLSDADLGLWLPMAAVLWACRHAAVPMPSGDGVDVDLLLIDPAPLGTERLYPTSSLFEQTVGHSRFMVMANGLLQRSKKNLFLDGLHPIPADHAMIGFMRTPDACRRVLLGLGGQVNIAGRNVTAFNL